MRENVKGSVNVKTLRLFFCVNNSSNQYLLKLRLSLASAVIFNDIFKGKSLKNLQIDSKFNICTTGTICVDFI